MNCSLTNPGPGLWGENDKKRSLVDKPVPVFLGGESHHLESQEKVSLRPLRVIKSPRKIHRLCKKPSLHQYLSAHEAENQQQGGSDV